MPIGKLVALLSASGAALFKSKRDQMKRANSMEAQIQAREFDWLYGALPAQRGYNRVLEFDLIHKKIRDDLAMFREMLGGDTTCHTLTQHQWIMAYRPGGHLDYKEYVLEYVRKSVYMAGYMPSCQPIGKPRRLAPPPGGALYSGRISGNRWKIDWENGIPDQEERRRLQEGDKTCPTSYFRGDQ